MCFVLFGCIWDRLVALKNSRQNRPNWCKSSCHEVTSGFFATNAPDPPHWTLNSCFGMFHTILMHLGPFGWLAKLDGKRAELMQKFVPRNRVRIFPNKRTRSTPFNPTLMFWCVFRTIWVYSGPFHCLTKLGGKWAELVQKFVPRSCVGIFRYERTRSPPLDPKLIYLVRFVQFGCIWDHSVALQNSVQNGPN